MSIIKIQKIQNHEIKKIKSLLYGKKRHKIRHITTEGLHFDINKALHTYRIIKID